MKDLIGKLFSEKIYPGIVMWIFSFILLIASSCFSQENITAIYNVSLIPMTSDTVLPGQTVLIKDGIIYENGSSSKIIIPSNAFIIDGTGGYLMPGLADMHTHIGNIREYPDLNLFAAYGVTTVRDLPQGSPPSILKMNMEINAGKRFGPSIIIANHIMGIESDPSKSVYASKINGYDGVKMNSYFTPEEFLETTAEAKKHGVYAFGHLPFLVSFENILNSGYNESTHVLELAWDLTDVDIKNVREPDSVFSLIRLQLFDEFSRNKDLPEEAFEKTYKPRIKNVVDKIGDRDFSISTTLVAEYDIMIKLLFIDTLKNSAYSKYISKYFWEDINTGNDKHFNMYPDPQYTKLIYRIACMIFKELIAQKKMLVLGTDVGPTYLSFIPGYSVHQELKLMVDNGLTPYQAIQTATVNAAVIAQKMTGKGNFGMVKKGMRADLLLLDENPFEDINNAQKIKGVILRGKYFTREELDSVKTIKHQNIYKKLVEAYKAGGYDELTTQYQAFKDDNYFNKYYYTENTLLRVAYDLIEANLPEEALKVFVLNAAEYPEASNAFDSLGETYLKLGERNLAIENYRKAVQIDPNFQNSVKVLSELVK